MQSTYDNDDDDDDDDDDNDSLDSVRYDPNYLQIISNFLKIMLIVLKVGFRGFKGLGVWGFWVWGFGVLGLQFRGLGFRALGSPHTSHTLR